jgi:hypothetical protein
VRVGGDRTGHGDREARRVAAEHQALAPEAVAERREHRGEQGGWQHLQRHEQAEPADARHAVGQHADRDLRDRLAPDHARPADLEPPQTRRGRHRAEGRQPRSGPGGQGRAGSRRIAAHGRSSIRRGDWRSCNR